MVRSVDGGEVSLDDGNAVQINATVFVLRNDHFFPAQRVEDASTAGQQGPKTVLIPRIECILKALKGGLVSPNSRQETVEDVEVVAVLLQSQGEELVEVAERSLVH